MGWFSVFYLGESWKFVFFYFFLFEHVNRNEGSVCAILHFNFLKGGASEALDVKVCLCEEHE